MQVTCPHCSTRYILPESLLGPLGARVRCPRCREAFTVEPPAPVEKVAEVAAPEPAPVRATEPSEWSRRVDAEPAQAATPAAAAPEGRPIDPADVARAALDEIAPGAGEEIAQAFHQGHLFEQYGEAIVGAYEVYRRKIGPAADPTPFRAAMRERWGVDLEPGSPVVY